MTVVRHLPVCLFVLLLAPATLDAKRLPIKTYSTADGLARDTVYCIVQDSHGFLWFCTAEGLSRFDGYQFTSYRTEQGLPGNVIADFIETRRGVYWIATTRGLVRFDPGTAGAARFHRFPLNSGGEAARPGVLYEDRTGGVWCGTHLGVFYLEANAAEFRKIDLPLVDPVVTSLVMDRDGALWVGTVQGVYRRDPDGSAEDFRTSQGLPNDYIMALLVDRAGRLWVGTREGLLRFDKPPRRGQPLSMRVYLEKDGLPFKRIESLFESSDGTLWTGTGEGVAEWTPRDPQGGHEFQGYSQAQGLSGRKIAKMGEDRDGNLWVGTFGSGAMKVARNGFASYGASDGAPNPMGFFSARSGEMCFLLRWDGTEEIAAFNGRRFDVVRPAWPSGLKYWGWGHGQIALQDNTGEWWIATGEGLYRFARTNSPAQLAGANPKAVYTSRDGLPGNKVFHIFEDSASGIWIGTEDGLARWDRGSGKLQAFARIDGFANKPVVNAFAEDRSSGVWMTLYHGGVMRYRNGRFEGFTERDGITGFLYSIFADSKGRLWIGSSRGVIRCDDPSAERPHFITYTTAQGLSSDDIAWITEDQWGRIYVDTGRGLDRFEPRPEGPARMKHFTSADGIVPGELDLAAKDSSGALWFTSDAGVSQLVPTEDRPRMPPPVLITGLSTGGVPSRISDLGEASISGLKLHQNSLRIDYVGLGFSPGEALRYQYKLEGAEGDWTPPSDQRTVIYASLSPGTYRFLVRAVTSDGITSPRPASVAFAILPPLWRNWWFLSACGIALGLIIYGLHRYRLAQVLAVANVRTSIATDLHDDIGASLSQIAILSEVAQREADGRASPMRKPLSEIAGISREVLDSMSDIVWAINPEHDRLSNLVHRMRRFATDLLGGQKIGLQFRSSVGQDLKIGANVRRQVYLIFKEAIHNIARHSGASQVDVELDRVEDTLILQVRDDGRGFDPAGEYEGHGLTNMRKRAAALGGKLEMTSAAGGGCTVKVSLRLEAYRSSLSMLRG